MVQLAFLAILPLALPALGANFEARENWGSSATTNAQIVYPSSSYAGGDYPTVTVSATASGGYPYPTYFDCGGSNFTVTWSDGPVPTGVTTISTAVANATAYPGSTSVGVVYPSGPVSISPSDGVVRRENWGATSSQLLPSSIAEPPRSTSVPVIVNPSAPSPISSTSVAVVCPYPTSTVYASASTIIAPSSSRAGGSPSGTGTPDATQLGAQGSEEEGGAVRTVVGSGSVFAALLLFANLI